MLSDKNTCSVCGSTLQPTGYARHWLCCPNCEPQMFPKLIPDGFALVRKPTLIGKGTPQDRPT